ncbi:YARHG domain-containing protein [Bacillota bacterium Meth-B3]
MNYARRVGALLLVCALLAGMLPALAEAQEAGGDRSTHGAFATQLGGIVYAALYTGSEYGLYSVPTQGGELKQLDVAADLGELVAANGFVYYMRVKDGVQQIMRVDEAGAVSVLSDFESGVTADRLSWYEDVLYCVANGRLYIVDPNTGESLLLCDEPVSDYAIVSNVIYYISGAEMMNYERTVTGQEAPVTQEGGTLWSMSIMGTNPERLVQKGVTDLRALGNYLFFHNLEDNYLMGSANEMWLEGKLYRYNIETAQMSSMNLDYDWDYYPTEKGVVVYSSQDISLYPLTGGEKRQVMAPELRANVTANGDCAFVYEYTAGKLTKLPLDGSPAITLADDSDVLPTISNAAPEDELPVDDAELGGETGDVGEGTDDGDADVPDESYDDEKDASTPGTSSSYIFANSSKKKLTRKQVLAIDKSLWGYARNEIYARHGYAFKNSKYKRYFSKKSWYSAGGFASSKLSTIEWYNMELIKGLEEEYGLLEGTGSSSSNSSAKDNTYILKEASSKKLTKKYLRDKLGSKSKYALARNEILARHGYVFKTDKYKKYFRNQKWYKPGGYSSGDLSKTEWHNIELLKELEDE